jgi:hypothetical protein
MIHMESNISLAGIVADPFIPLNFNVRSVRVSITIVVVRRLPRLRRRHGFVDRSGTMRRDVSPAYHWFRLSFLLGRNRQREKR